MTPATTVAATATKTGLPSDSARFKTHIQLIDGSVIHRRAPRRRALRMGRSPRGARYPGIEIQMISQ